MNDPAAPRVLRDQDVDVVLEAGAALGEGPVWDEIRQELWWVDISGHQLHRWSAASGDRVVLDAGTAIGSVALTTDGRVVAAVDQDLALVTRDGSITVLVTVGDVVEGGVLNDCGCDPDGNLWVGVSTAE
jgi:sugar lactone lactonase YvrE